MNLSHPMCRFVIVAVLLSTAAIYLESHRRGELIPEHPKFETFPGSIGSWKGRDTTLTPDVLPCGRWSRSTKCAGTR